MEKDDEVAGEGNSYTAMFWQYDSRLARRWNLDPKPNLSISQYACFAGNPIMYTDPLGDTTYTFTRKGDNGYFHSVDYSGDGVFGKVIDSKGKELQTFEFNDPVNDVKNLEKHKDDMNYELVWNEDELTYDEVSSSQRPLIFFKNKGDVSNYMKQSKVGEKGGSLYEIASKSDRGGLFDYWGTYLSKEAYEAGYDIDNITKDEGPFVIFENTSKAYNLMDAGNFLWGATMAQLKHTSKQALNNANAYAYLIHGTKDSQGDQNAIRDGSYYQWSKSEQQKFESDIQRKLNQGSSYRPSMKF